MKKVVSILLLATGLLLANPGFAQTYYGIKTGFNFNKADDSNLADNLKSKNASGYFVGPMLETKLPLLGLRVDGALLYSQRSSKFSYSSMGVNDEMTVKQHAIEIPVNLKWVFGIGDLLGIFVATGPDFIFNVKSDNMMKELSGLGGSPEAPFKNKTKKAEMTWNIGAGVSLIQFLQIGLTYNIPLSNNVSGNIDGSSGSNLDTIFKGENFKTKNRTWQLSLALLF